jgi:hypothetical protein
MRDVVDGRSDATNVGRLLAASATSDITGAYVVICARRSVGRWSPPIEVTGAHPTRSSGSSPL